jgi:hypothetical protein
MEEYYLIARQVLPEKSEPFPSRRPSRRPRGRNPSPPRRRPPLLPPPPSSSPPEALQTKLATLVKGAAGIWPLGSLRGVLEGDLCAGFVIAEAAVR